jgi:hypothetical protein
LFSAANIGFCQPCAESALAWLRLPQEEIPVGFSVHLHACHVNSTQMIFLIEGGLYSVTALRETWARRQCILNTRIYHKQASTTSKAHFTRRSSSSSGSHSASSASVASSLCGVLSFPSFRGFVFVGRTRMVLTFCVNSTIGLVLTFCINSTRA